MNNHRIRKSYSAYEKNSTEEKLRVKFGSNLPFENHFNSLCKKASQKLPALDDFKGNIWQLIRLNLVSIEREIWRQSLVTSP